MKTSNIIHSLSGLALITSLITITGCIEPYYALAPEVNKASAELAQ